MLRFTILVVGLSEQHAGKTTLTRAIIRYLKERDLNPCAFKPKAANSVWYDFDIVQESLSKGRLYGMDAKLLREESETSLIEEVINPIHRLWNENDSLEFILDRIYFNGKIILIVGNSFWKINSMIEGLFDSIYSEADSIVEVNGERDTVMELSRYYNDSIKGSFKEISKRHETMVVESYSDVATPWKDLKPDIVFGIKPWKVFLYDGERYTMALDILHGEEISTQRVVSLLEPIKQICVLPRSSTNVVNHLKERIHSLLREYL